jgi:hypothetical protein
MISARLVGHIYSAGQHDANALRVRPSCVPALPVALLLVLILGGQISAGIMNPIQKENRQPGTTAWQLTNPADNRQIEGYASLTSVAVGGDISLFVNTADTTYSLTVFRMGWYGGKGGRKVLGPQVLNGVQQVTPDPSKGLVERHPLRQVLLRPQEHHGISLAQRWPRT